MGLLASSGEAAFEGGLVGGFRSTGAVMLNRVTVDGRLDCTGATLVCEHSSPENPRGTALEAYGASNTRRDTTGMDVDAGRRR